MDYLTFSNLHLIQFKESNTFRQSILHFAIHWYVDSILIDFDDFIVFIETLIDIYPDVINKQDIFGLTALHYAVEFDQLQLARLLLHKGASVRTQDIYGETAADVSLSYYSSNPQSSQIRTLLNLHKRIAAVKFKIRFLGMLMCMYRKCIERVYAPNGVGYVQAKKDFESLLVL